MGVLNATIGGTIAFVITICLTTPKGQVWILIFPYVIVSAGLVLVNMIGVRAFRTAQDRLSKAVAWLFPISINVVGVITVLNLFSQGVGTIGISLVSVLAFCTLSALWPRHFMGRFLLDWTAQGAGTAYAARSLARQYAKATREIRELTHTTTPETSPTLRQRTVAAFRVFRTGWLDTSEIAVDKRTG